MPLSPPVPSDLPALVDAFEQTLRAVLDLGQGCTTDDFGLATECPGWTVQDQLAHVSSIEVAIAGGAEPPEVPDLPHVLNEFGRYMERGVAERRWWSGQRVVDELADVIDRRMAALRAPGLTAETPVTLPLSISLPATTLGELMVLRTRDVWAHEQDIRVALGRPGGLDTVGAAIFTQTVFRSLGLLSSRVARVPAGEVVVLESTGPVVGVAGVRIGVRDDGKPLGIGLSDAEIQSLRAGIGSAGDGTSDSAGSGTEVIEPTAGVIGATAGVTWISIDTEALTRRGGGRRSTDATPYAVSGDPGIARAVVEALVITP